MRPENARGLGLEEVQKCLGLKRVVTSKQVHGKKVREVYVDGEKPGECDALITQERGLGIAVLHADCQAAFFYDPLQRRIAAVHCGWKGSVQNIYGETVKAMGSDPKNLKVTVSPSLGPEKAEFIHYKKELPVEFYPFQISPTYFDFWAISEMQLLKAGILKENIEMAKMCTCSDAELFYSYRRDKTALRHISVIALN